MRPKIFVFRFAAAAVLLGTSTIAFGGPADSVLYDQSEQFYFGSYEGIRVDDYLRPADGAYSTQGADDFVVTDPAGWTVTKFSFLGGGTTYLGAGGPASPTIANVYVFPDNQGFPAATPVCSAPNTPIVIDDSVDPPFLLAELGAPCALPQGKYWVATEFVSDSPHVEIFYWTPMSMDTGPHGSPGVWRNPGNGYGANCRAWGTLRKCNLTHTYWSNPSAAEYVFKVIGHSGIEAGGISLVATAGLVDANHPDACAAASVLDVTPGDQVNLCYRVTNHSGADLAFQSLTDSIDGEVFPTTAQTINNGATYQYNRVVTVGTETQRVSTWTAQDQVSGYTYDDTVASEFIDLTASPTASDLDIPYGREDDWTTAIYLPGSFPFFGQSYDVLCIGNNGFIMPASSTVNINCAPGFWQVEPLPSTQFPYPAILPSWVDLYSAGRALYDRQTSPPGTTKYIVEWYLKNRYDPISIAPGNVTFEVVIDASTGQITFQYASMAFADSHSPSGDYGQGAAVGLQRNATSAIQYAYRQPVLTNGKAIRWTPSTPVLHTSSANVQFNVGAPVIGTTPQALAASVTAGSQTSTTLTVGNSGNRNLQWTINQVPASSHFPVLATQLVVPMGDPAATRTSRAPARAQKPGEPAPASGPPLTSILPVPSYALTYDVLYQELNYVALDAAQPTRFTTISHAPTDPVPNPGGGNHAVDFSASTFTDNDFTKEYLLDRNGAFGTIDVASGAFTLINNMILPQSCDIGFPCWTALRWDATSGTMFAVSAMVPSDEAGIQSQLYTIDRATGAVSPVGQPMPNVVLISMAIDPQGLMYGLDAYNDQLVAIDKTTGNFQFIGSIGFDLNFDQDMDFDPSTGILWYAGVDAQGTIAMYTINTTTGAATYYSPLFGYNEILALSIAVPSGPCGRPADSPWLSLNVTGGTTAPGSSYPVAVALDSRNLVAGTYRANICIPSNDPIRRNHPLAVPVEFEVTTTSEAIFANGFDSTSP